MTSSFKASTAITTLTIIYSFKSSAALPLLALCSTPTTIVSNLKKWVVNHWVTKSSAIGKAVKEVPRTKDSSWWCTPHMAAASRAIAERILLVDLVLDVRGRKGKTTSMLFGGLLQ